MRVLEIGLEMLKEWQKDGSKINYRIDAYQEI